MSEEINQNQCDFNKMYAESLARDKERGTEAVNTLKDMMRKMQADGIYDELEFTFDGCGDDGEIHDCCDSNGGSGDDLRTEIADFLNKNHYILDIENSYTDRDGNIVKKYDNPNNVYLYDLLYYVLEMVEGGWEINEGSSGSIRLKFGDKDTCSVNVNCTVNVREERDHDL